MRSTCARRRHAQIAFADTKHADFRIGSEFLAVAGFRWRCTDIGTRTIVAIRVDHGNSDWYQGPPYVAKEVVFDEAEMLECHRTIEEAIEAAVHEDETSGHPGYPAEVVSRMMEACSATRYPNDGVLRFDRCRPDGEILHAYAGRKEGNRWVLELYLPFCETFETMTEDAPLRCRGQRRRIYADVRGALIATSARTDSRNSPEAKRWLNRIQGLTLQVQTQQRAIPSDLIGRAYSIGSDRQSVV